MPHLWSHSHDNFTNRMKYLLLVAALVFSFATIGLAAEKKAAKPTKSDNKSDEKKPRLRHVVAFKFKEGTTKEQIKQVETAFRDLQKRIPEIKKFEWGMNNSPEGKNKGCTHAFVLTFRTEKDRDTYLPHAAHKEFGKLVGPLIDDVFVLDYWAKG